MGRNGLRKFFGLCITLMAVFIIMMVAFAFLRGKAIAQSSIHVGADEPGGGYTFYQGITVDGISVGGKTLNEALELVVNKQKQTLDACKVTLSAEGQKKDIIIDQTMITDDIREILNQAFLVGRTGTAEERDATISSLKSNPKAFTTSFTVDTDLLRQSVLDTVVTFGKVPVNATFLSFDATKPEGERFQYTPDEDGVQADPEVVWQAVQQAFANKQYGEIAIQLNPVKANVTVDNLKGINQRVVQFTSKMKRDNNRISNIELACNTIAGFILMPGEEFSFNEVVGPRTESRGYKEAGVIVGGDRIDVGMGGGICQVSGTLYNAVLRADLKVIERTHHSFELAYLTRGRDATVDYGRKDFKFMNNRTTPVYIVMYSDAKELTVTAEVYGEPLPNDQTIDIVVETKTKDIKPPPPEVLYVKLSTLLSGETKIVKPVDGFKCKVYKVYKDKDGKQVGDKVWLYDDTYNPIQAKVYYSPLDPAPTPLPTATLSPAPTEKTTVPATGTSTSTVAATDAATE